MSQRFGADKKKTLKTKAIKEILCPETIFCVCLHLKMSTCNCLGLLKETVAALKQRGGSAV